MTLHNDFPYPLATVGGLVFAPDGDTLWVRSYKWGNRYSLPGGKVDLGETLAQAVIREVLEETGLVVINPKLATVQDCVYSPEFWKKGHFVMHDYLLDLSPESRKEDVVLNEEAQSYVWVSPKKALELPIIEPGRNLLNWYLSYVRNNKL